jgi:hypothetical protein
VSAPTHWSHLLWRKAREPQRKKTKRKERQVVVPIHSAFWVRWGLWQRPLEEIWRYFHFFLLQFSSQIHSPWVGDIVDFGIGLSIIPPVRDFEFGYRFTFGTQAGVQLLSPPTLDLPSPPERVGMGTQ